MCGGTFVLPAAKQIIYGLSPRVRGNPKSTSRTSRTGGSIPACAGEPPIRTCYVIANGVYPRVCGGTPGLSREEIADTGLSPRVRGNHVYVLRHDDRTGSIPACAGEPVICLVALPALEVYPRVCGGTVLSKLSSWMINGLSPRVRGNPVRSSWRRTYKWSIPACAGEPLSTTLTALSPTVYPRVCGGTASCQWGPAARYGLSPRVRGNPLPIDIGCPMLFGRGIVLVALDQVYTIRIYDALGRFP